jgi:hypothetical protein
MLKSKKKSHLNSNTEGLLPCAVRASPGHALEQNYSADHGSCWIRSNALTIQLMVSALDFIQQNFKSRVRMELHLSPP